MDAPCFGFVGLWIKIRRILPDVWVICDWFDYLSAVSIIMKPAIRHELIFSFIIEAFYNRKRRHSTTLGYSNSTTYGGRSLHSKDKKWTVKTSYKIKNRALVHLLQFK